MKPIDTYIDTANRARQFLQYHDGLINTRARRIRADWKASFLTLMHWPKTSEIDRIDSKDAVLILRHDASMTAAMFTRHALDDQLRAALIFGVSALDRYVHERVVKGIVAALKAGSLTRQQEEFSIPVSTAIAISEESIAAFKKRKRIRPANIIRRQVQELLHKRPFQSYREIDYAFNLLGIKNLNTQLLSLYGISDLQPIKTTLGHIAMRRNYIVHEGDLVRHERGGRVRRHEITRGFVEDSLDFLDELVFRLEFVA